MANLEQIIANKNASDTQWQHQQQAERENVTEMQNCGIEMITTDPAQYFRYLTMQGDNPGYSAGNVAIVLAGLNGATVFGTRERWQSMGRTVLEEQQSQGVKIFARDPRTKAYALADAYDISQTQGREIKRRTLRENTEEMSSALSTLLNYSKAKLDIDKDLATPAYFDEQSRELVINPDYQDEEAFASIAAEVALTRYHDKGYNRDYSWARYELDKMQDMSKQIGRSIDLNIEAEKRKTRTAVRRPAR